MKIIIKIIIIIIIYNVIIFTLNTTQNTKNIKDISNITINEIYDLLQQIVCLFNNSETEYIMTGGTLLGAIRHHGLIPWDDDADLIVFNKTPKDILRILEPLRKSGIVSYEHIKGNIIVVKFDVNNSNASIDIFFMKKSRNIMDNQKVYKYLFPFNIQYVNEWFTEEELYPLKDYNFGPLILKGPNNYENFLDRTYPNWKNTASKWNHLSFGTQDIKMNNFTSALPDLNFSIRQCYST